MDTELKKKLDRMNKYLSVYAEEGQDKHLKGYMFDSLVYRYKLARHRMAELEREEDRDVMRFVEILDEAIGERD